MLFLLTEEELNNLNSEIIAEVQVGVGVSNIESLLLLDTTDIIITTAYVEYVGIDRCISFFRAAQLFKKFNFFYLTANKKLDTFATYLVKEVDGPSLINISIKYLTYERFKSIISGSYVTSVTEKDLQDFRNDYILLTNLIDEVKHLEDAAKQNAYIKDNSSRILNLLPVIENIFQENKDIKCEYDDKDNLCQLLTTTVEKLQHQLKLTQSQLSSTTDTLNKARSYITHNQRKITSYNEILNRSHSSLHSTYQTPSKTLVFYFKELDDVKFYPIYRHLVYTFMNVFKVYTKSLIIENPTKDYLNSYMHDSIYEYTGASTYKDITNHDSLLCYGNARYLLEFLTKEEVKLDVLFIYDRLHSLTPVIDSPRCCTLIIGNHISDYQGVIIPDECFISPYEGFYAEEMVTLEPVRESITDDFNARIYIQRTNLMHFLMQIATPSLLSQSSKPVSLEKKETTNEDEDAVKLLESALNMKLEEVGDDIG